jgi:2'-5' RNA ligase
VTALFGDEDFALFDGLRRLHFPPERNVLRAHLTLFHHLPQSVERELSTHLKQVTKDSAPSAMLAGVMSLGRGVAFRIRSEELEAIRAEIAARFAELLIPQDKPGWRPHVTVQNKVEPIVARNLQNALEAAFVPRPVQIVGLAIWHYLGGPWKLSGAWRFGSGHPMRAPS